MSIDCPVCTDTIKYPVLFRCGHQCCHSCLNSAVVSKTSVRYPPKLAKRDVSASKAIGKIKLEAPIKCFVCSSGQVTDVLLTGASIVPENLLKDKYPGFEDWSCPYCNLQHAGSFHVRDCKERHIPCKYCETGKIPLCDPSDHLENCALYRCTENNCDAKSIKFTLLQMQDHRSHHIQNTVRDHLVGELKKLRAHDKAENYRDYDTALYGASHMSGPESLRQFMAWKSKKLGIHVSLSETGGHRHDDDDDDDDDDSHTHTHSMSIPFPPPSVMSAMLSMARNSLSS